MESLKELGKVKQAWARSILFSDTRVSTTESGSMFTVTDATNWEIFSYTGKGAIQANGYAIDHAGYPRILNVIDGISDFSIHDMILVDCKYNLLDRHQMEVNRL
jgi:rhamnogalacturonan hydrolase